MLGCFDHVVDCENHLPEEPLSIDSHIFVIETSDDVKALAAADRSAVQVAVTRTTVAIDLHLVLVNELPRKLHRKVLEEQADGVASVYFRAIVVDHGGVWSEEFVEPLALVLVDEAVVAVAQCPDRFNAFQAIKPRFQALDILE